MPVSFAACEEYVFKRDFVAQKWIPIEPNNKPCRVQFLKSDGRFLMRLTQSDGKRSDFAVSRDNKLHFSNDGFIQIPLADIKELYAIKFKQAVDGETFYAKIVNGMDLAWSAPKTTIGPDQMPNPAVDFGPPRKSTPHQTLPPNPRPVPVDTSRMQNQFNPPPSQPQPQPQGISMPPSMVNQPFHSGSANPQPVPPNIPHQKQGSMDSPGYQPSAQKFAPQEPQYQQHQQGFGNPSHQEYGGRDQYGNPPNNQYGNQMPQNPQFQNRIPQDLQFQSQIPQDSQFQNQNQYDRVYTPPHPNNAGGNQHPLPRRIVESQGFQPQPHQNLGPPLQPHPEYHNLPQFNGRPMNGGGYNQGNQERPPRPPKTAAPPKRRREPEVVDESQLGTLALSLMKAINQGDRDHAQQLLQKALTAKANLKIEFDEIPKPEPEPEFMLEVVIEFQQPQKKPLPIYLDNIRESFTIFDLQTMVEHKFFIPRSSQNWIIGSKLIKNDEKLPLTHYGLSHIKSTTSAKVYLYVMHTKKANVAKEELELIQSRQRAQLNRQQENLQSGHQAPLPPASQGLMSPNQQGQQPNYPQGQQGLPPMNRNQQGQQPNYPQGQQPNYPQGQQPNYPQGQQPNYPQNVRGPTHGQMAGDPNQSAFPNPGYGGQQDYRGNFPQGNQGNMRGSPMQQVPPMQYGMAGDPTYDRIGNRGYNPGFTDAGIAKFRVDQDPAPPQPNPYLQGNEPLYQRLNAQGGIADPSPQVQGGRIPPSGDQNVIPRGQNAQQPQNSQQVLGFPPQLNAAPAPDPPKEQVGWKCPDCTFINKPRRPGCEICTHPRPEDYDVPDDVPLDTLQLDAQKNEELFHQYEKQEEERRKEEALKNYQALIEAEDAEVVTNKEEFDCLICYVPTEPGEGIILRECLHEFCKPCLHDTIMNAATAVVNCPFDDGNYQCGVAISEREMRAVLADEELETVHKRGLREAESASPNSFHCKTTDCGGFCFYEDDVNEFQCPVCTKRNCLLCKAIHEGMDCKEYQDDLKRRAANDEAAKATQNMLEEMVKGGDAMYCPQCKIIVQKKDGCDWIRCSMCRTEICWATKGRRWGPKGYGDTSGGCRCRVNGKKCTPMCRNCH